MKILLLACWLSLTLCASSLSSGCEITSNLLDDQERSIEVDCPADGVKFQIKLMDNNGTSSLDVAGKGPEQTTKFFTVTRQEPNIMTLILNGRWFDLSNSSTAAEEHDALEILLENPDFAPFPEVVRMIHDELELPGWENPSVMFMYQAAMALSNHPSLRETRQRARRNAVGYEGLVIDENGNWCSPTDYMYHLYRYCSRPICYPYDIVTDENGNWCCSNYYIYRKYRLCTRVDRKVFHYHGEPSDDTKVCKHNGTPKQNLRGFIENDCYGMCGLGCDCWTFVCGDCCVHSGCQKHDDHCREDFTSEECLKLKDSPNPFTKNRC